MTTKGKGKGTAQRIPTDNKGTDSNAGEKAKQGAFKQTTAGDKQAGDASRSSSSESVAVPNPPRETRAQAERRWRRTGQDIEVGNFRGKVRDACVAAGMTRKAANEHAWEEALAAYPPPGVDPVEPKPLPDGGKAQLAPDPPNSGDQVQGLGSIPKDWPPLPDNASQQAELAWVQSQRLRVVSESSSGQSVVDLSQASAPAPSWAALGWLETSIRSYAKYVDIVGRALASQDDEKATVRRERVDIARICELLEEMRENRES